MTESTDPWVTALLWLDADGNGELYGSIDSPNVIFNAAPYLLLSEFNARDLDELSSLPLEGDYIGWDYLSDYIARFAADYDTDVQAVFDSKGKSQGFECCIDWGELVALIKVHRPELIQQSRYFKEKIDDQP